MGNCPIEIFLFCDFEDTPLARALSDQLSANGIVASYGHDLDGSVLDRCQSVAVCVGENTSLTPTVCKALQTQHATRALAVIILYLPNAYWEDSAWLPANPIEFKSDNDPSALGELMATIRPSVGTTVAACGLTSAEVAQLGAWRPVQTEGSILIVDDNPDLLRFVSQVLQRKGWAVATAESAQQAVEVMGMSGRKPNIALLDYILPDTSGLAFGLKLREQAPTISVVIASGVEPTPEDLVTCEENDFLVLMKPFLAATLARILDRIRRRQMRMR